MQFKEYQQRVLDTFDAFLDELIAQREKAKKIEAANRLETDPDLIRDVPHYPAKAWDAMATAGRVPALHGQRGYSKRTTGDGKPCPNVTLKVPTGGGKTLLASAAVCRLVNKYNGTNNGLVLWIVPNEAIYSQTKAQLTDRDHPFRQMLDRAGAGRVKILEKDSPLSRADVDGHLCVMLLMLPSANRQTKETLRLFRDRGNVHGFTPPEGSAEAHEELAAQVPNLDAYADVTVGYRMIKDSLGNVLRLMRPVLVMDEGQKAFSQLAYDTLYGFNPSFVLELTATPKGNDQRWANCLVDVSGVDLDREEMIKMPIDLTVHGGDDWRDTLRQAWECTKGLQAKADDLMANTSRYIRPIMLVQVERTGNDTVDGGHIHSKDVIAFLETLGLPREAIAEKTATVNELKDYAGKKLLEPTNPIRVIVTKQALQEGWDCPFAYVLCSLAASSNLGAMTQLVGRILRQPDTVKTKVGELDRCYIHCFHARTGLVVEAIKDGLKGDGMGDLTGKLSVTGQNENGGSAEKPMTRSRRPIFAATRIFLPRVLFTDRSTPRLLDWEMDILYRVEWAEVVMDDWLDELAGGSAASHTERRLIDMDIVRETRRGYAAGETVELDVRFDPVYATRSITDVVPNAWVAREIVGRMLTGLTQRGWSDAKIGNNGSFLIEELRKHLVHERDRLCEEVFRNGVQDGSIQFRLRTDVLDWAAPESDSLTLPPRPRPMVRAEDGREVERSLMHPVYEHELNGLEFDVACYLDKQKALAWWYRNVVAERAYHLQGWRRNRVYPDLLFAFDSTGGTKRLVVLETKGDQLSGNLDTRYKEALMELLTSAAKESVVSPVGSFEMELSTGEVIECELVHQERWENDVAGILAR